jgi:signal transduction histidine kinase
MQCVIDFNLGLNYLFIEKWNTGLKYLWKSCKNAPLHKRFDIQQMAYINLGDYYLNQKNYDSAFIYYQKVGKHPEVVNSWQKTQLYRGLAQYYLTQNNITEAEKFANDALKLAKKSNSKWEISSNLSTLAEIAYKKELFEEAFLLKKQEKAYNDTLSSEKTINKIKYIIHKKKEAEFHELTHKSEEAESNLTSAIWAVAITLLFLIASLLLLSLISKRLKTKNISNKFLDEKNNDLEENLATKTKILSIISHDMKSPLAAIKQILTMYNNQMLTREEQDSLLKKLLIQVESTIEMLNNLVFWAKKQAQGIKINKVAICPIRAIREIIHYNKIVLELKNIDVHLMSEGFEKTKVIIDPDQFQIICQNLLGNSIKYSHNSNEIHIRFLETEKMLRIHFIDFGMGMEAAKIEEILSKSTNIKSKTGTNEEKGSGLGLILVQSLLELNDGYLEIKSEVNKGSEIIINLVKAI